MASLWPVESHQRTSTLVLGVSEPPVPSGQVNPPLVPVVLKTVACTVAEVSEAVPLPASMTPAESRDQPVSAVPLPFVQPTTPDNHALTNRLVRESRDIELSVLGVRARFTATLARLSRARSAQDADVQRVPDVGKVTEVFPVTVPVKVCAPEKVTFPPIVIVLALATPVP